MTKPDFLIIGTMKGGTTILYDFICDHPDVSAAQKKEIHYFSLNYDKGDEWYYSHFDELGEGQLTGEASPTYFDMATGGVIPKVIKKDLSDVKLILVVRDPIERAISHYNHYCVIDKVDSIKEMGIERFFNRSYSDAVIATTPEQYYLYHVLNFSCYRKKHRYYKDLFQDNLLVVQNTELRKNSKEVMSNVHSHLGLEDRNSALFSEVRYSAGTSKAQISDETLKKLQSFLYPDYEGFCSDAGLVFEGG